jgi:hypothetical protein
MADRGPEVPVRQEPLDVYIGRRKPPKSRWKEGYVWRVIEKHKEKGTPIRWGLFKEPDSSVLKEGPECFPSDDGPFQGHFMDIVDDKK